MNNALLDELRTLAAGLTEHDKPATRSGHDGECAYSENADGETLYSIGFDMSGEGDYEQWNRAAIDRARFFDLCLLLVPELVSPLVIEVRRRSEDYHAQVRGNPGMWGCGTSATGAVGDVIVSHRDRLPKLPIEIEYITKSEKPDAAVAR